MIAADRSSGWFSRLRWTALCLLGAVLISACGSTPQATHTPTIEATLPRVPSVRGPSQEPARLPGALGDVIGRSDNLLVYLPARGDTLPAIALRFLGGTGRLWEIEQANGLSSPGADPAPLRLEAGTPLIVPLAPRPALGVTAAGVQTVPILCYHRFGTGSSKMIVSTARFEAQLAWLQKNDYHVVRLSDLGRFLSGQQALPPRSVVITIDDGYGSVYRHAYPALKKHGYSATLFVYTDFIGARDGLSWAQLQEMAQSGLIDIQAHSRSHRNLVERLAGESDAGFKRALQSEVGYPRALLNRRLGSAGVQVRQFAYPYGDADDLVLEVLRKEGYELGLTVTAGGNAFYADPLLLRRTMIFGDHDLEDFEQRLTIRRPLAQP